ncbi:MAG: peptidase [Gemmatimonadetes bacterium]|nr:MAG: peptidase [Gemmatimonadota bacterium]
MRQTFLRSFTGPSGRRGGAAGRAAAAALLALAATLPVGAQQHVTSPEEAFGHPIGADYQLIDYTQLYEYWHTLASESDRMTVHDIGLTEEGRPQIMAIITAPANRPHLDRYREIARRLAKAEGVSEDEARALASEGKAVVWIDGGLHATEVLGAQQLTELVYRMVSRDDPETLRILDDVILLAVHANPDGMELVSDWYMREPDPLKRSTAGVPVLYEKYAGHDNNRDFYMSALSETTNMNRVMYREWFPQIVYNHHQTGPAGTVMFAPPFRDPPNHNLDPLILTSLDAVGAAMHGRFVREGKGGTTMRSGAGYSTWWNGGLRTTPYFHNMIGLLTETIGNPTPIEIPFIPDRQLPHGDLPLPVEPGPWHFRQSVEYSQTANMAVLDFASRNREVLLYNIWRMGRNAIERGSRDNWTIRPFQIDSAAEAVGRRGTRADYERLLRDPAKRDARGYIIPADQADFGTATKFVNALLKNGVDVHRATRAFEVGGKHYPAGSYVVKTAQAFRPHVLDMFEPQQHPNDFAYPGGPPTPPYDNAGWTLAYQMGVRFDRILDGFDGPFELITDELATPPPGRVAGAADPAGYLLVHEANDAFLIVNRVLAGGGRVYWLLEPVDADGMHHGPGTFFIAADGVSRAELEELARTTGLSLHAVADAPSGRALELHRPRIGLWDRYGGSMPSGWTRKILEDFGFDFEVVYPPELDRDDLNARFDVLIFEDGAIPGGADGQGGGFGGRMPPEMIERIPEPYRSRVGAVTVERTVPRILGFAERGGAVIAIGSSAALAEHAGLPVRNHLVDEDGNPLPREKYFTPGSVHDLKLEHVSPLTHGMGERLNVLISHSPLFTLDEERAAAVGVKRVGWFDTDHPLRSGWAWGQEHMKDGTAMLEAPQGQGKLFIFTPKITFRSQSHQAFPLLFNGIFYGSARETTLP